MPIEYIKALNAVYAQRGRPAAVKPPRAVFVNFPFGHTTGVPHDRPFELTIVRAALESLATVKEGGSIIDLPYV